MHSFLSHLEKKSGIRCQNQNNTRFYNYQGVYLCQKSDIPIDILSEI